MMASASNVFCASIEFIVRRDYSSKLKNNPCKFHNEFGKLAQYPQFRDNVDYGSALKRLTLTYEADKLNAETINKIVRPFVSKQRNLLAEVLNDMNRTMDKGQGSGYNILEFLLSADFPFEE